MRPPVSSRSTVSALLRSAHNSHCGCAACYGAVKNGVSDIANAALAIRSGGRARSYATPVDASQQKEYAFEVSAANLRFGEGVTRVSLSPLARFFPGELLVPFSHCYPTCCQPVIAAGMTLG